MNYKQTQLPGSYFHVYNRAPNNELVFTNTGSYHFFLKLLKGNLEKYEISMISYCLMPNHFHMLVQLNKEFSLSPFIQHTLNSYV